MTPWSSDRLGRAYGEVNLLRGELAQSPESGIDAALRDILDAIEAADVELEQVSA